jgi:hypothetical protein
MGEALSERRHAEVTETTSLRGGAVCLPDAFIPWNLSGHGVDISAWPAFFLKFLVLLVKIVSCSSKNPCPLPAPCAKGERFRSLTGTWPNQVFPTVCTKSRASVRSTPPIYSSTPHKTPRSPESTKAHLSRITSPDRQEEMLILNLHAHSGTTVKSSA